ncbi:MAG: hypothetical protein ACLUTA_17355 [Blautia wexlerae]
MDGHRRKFIPQEKDVHNILCCIGVYNELRNYSTYYPMEIDEMRYQSSSVFGLWYPTKKPGDLIKVGEYLGCTKDYRNVLEEKLFRFKWRDPLSGWKPAGIKKRVNDRLWQIQFQKR